MTIPDKIILEAAQRYERERDRYIKLAARVADLCRSDIVEANAIRAQVTSRTKTVKSFDGKLKRFAKRKDKNMMTVDEVFDQIGDFAGVRIATYRPEDQARVVDEVRKLFSDGDGGPPAIDLKQTLDPDEGKFYRATHCQVFLPDEELAAGGYENLKGTSCEVQICSMMAHVWNEIEHDIGYKPEGGGPGATEKGLLGALGHLTYSGDAIIGRLLAANELRLKEQTGDFVGVYDFVARMQSFFPEVDLSPNAGQTYEEAELLGLTSPEKIREALGANKINEAFARVRIGKFNHYLTKSADASWALDPRSSDLIMVLLLDKYAARIEENHPAGRGKGRPARARSIATRFKDFLEAESLGVDSKLQMQLKKYGLLEDEPIEETEPSDQV